MSTELTAAELSRWVAENVMKDKALTCSHRDLFRNNVNEPWYCPYCESEWEVIGEWDDGKVYNPAELESQALDALREWVNQDTQRTAWLDFGFDGSMSRCFLSKKRREFDPWKYDALGISDELPRAICEALHQAKESK